MIDELVIHVGDCKTGTTSIQTVLADNLVESEARLIYPARFNHIPFEKRLQSDVKGATYKDAIALSKSFRKAKGGIGVISAETFEFIEPQKLADLFDGPFKPWRNHVRVIGYIRPHAERFLSTFAERSKKGGFGGKMDVLAKRIERDRLLHYTPRVKKWKAVFGDRYTVRPFVRDQLLNQNVVNDLIDFILRGAVFRFTGETDQNESLSLEDLVLMRYTQRLLKEQGANLDEADKALGWNFSPILASLPAQKSTKLRLHESLAAKFQDTYAEDASALDALAFVGTPMTDRLKKASEGALKEPQSLSPKDHLSPEVMRLAKAYAQLLGRVMNANPGHFRWATRPEAYRMPLLELLKRELAIHSRR